MQPKKRQQGFSLIELLIVVAIIGIIAAIAIPNLLASRRAANEGSAIASMRTLGSAQATYLTTVGSNTAYAADLAALGPAPGAGLIDSVLASNTKTGYVFAMVGTGLQFNANADPVTQGTTGTRHFFTDETGVIRYDPLVAADVNSTPIQ